MKYLSESRFPTLILENKFEDRNEIDGDSAVGKKHNLRVQRVILLNKSNNDETPELTSAFLSNLIIYLYKRG